MCVMIPGINTKCNNNGVGHKINNPPMPDFYNTLKIW